MFALTWQSLQNVVAKPAAVADAVGQPGFLSPFRRMNVAAEPWGPCAAGEAASVLCQSLQVIVCVPRAAFHGASICAAASGLGVEFPV